MHAVHFWGQGTSYLSQQRVPYLRLKKRGREREKELISVFSFAHLLCVHIVFEQNFVCSFFSYPSQQATCLHPLPNPID